MIERNLTYTWTARLRSLDLINPKLSPKRYWWAQRFLEVVVVIQKELTYTWRCTVTFVKEVLASTDIPEVLGSWRERDTLVPYSTLHSHHGRKVLHSDGQRFQRFIAVSLIL